METTKFTWVPFYTELAHKLLEYKNKRHELIDFIFAEDGLLEFSKYLHLKDKNQRIDDIDPFSFFGMFNRVLGESKRLKVVKRIKYKFNINADMPSDFCGIPILNYTRNFFYDWNNLKESCNRLWIAFEAILNGNLEPWFEYRSFTDKMAETTMVLYWIDANKYINLDSKNTAYIKHYQINAKVNNIHSYLDLIEQIKSKIQSGEIKENSFMEFSYNAWLNAKDSTYYYAGFSFGGNNSQLDRFKAEGVWEGSGNNKVNNLIMGIKPNDILILKTSSTKGEKHDLPFIRIHAVGIVESEVEKIENSNHYRCSVNYIEMPDTKDFDGNKYGAYRQTLHECNDKEIIDYVNQLFAMDTTPTPNHIDKYAQILRHKKNLILQGAPGTGKTYNTAALALSICEVTDVNLKDHDAVMQRYKQLQDEGRIGFCTFHQSMDYEDFVEGIKPSTENQTVSYDVEDGIFKRLADRAKKNWEDSEKSIEVLQKQKSVTGKIDEFLSNAIEDVTKYQTKTGAYFTITGSDDKKIYINNPQNEKTPNIEVFMSDLTELLENDVPLSKVVDIKHYFKRKQGSQYDSYTFALYNEINKITTEQTVEVVETELQNYVLIIDEINRGNVSRIFGELITLLEADKRLGGEHPSEHPIEVTLPYSKERFGVPKNLYIIGTMNTTDRSVGNIDYAVRRRFAFATLESQRELVEQHSTEQGVRLYDAVRKFIEKSKAEMDFEDLMVGHSYFFVKSDEMLEMRWQYEIKPLLNEYIKDGLLNAETIGGKMTVEEFCRDAQRASADMESNG